MLKILMSEIHSSPPNKKAVLKKQDHVERDGRIKAILLRSQNWTTDLLHNLKNRY
jgi:hypothetical protein